ncbi:hypothetical protein GM668_18600 [Duganella ginsengisoli]|uniref:Uncharacterized protein n=1 Tax=Pseudoduganella ginsengisoli TaxID=1462440 RepID=A0A6L6Q3B3_9BURK|nr:hypothetical protein [Pseudoduganella ginsengisoli]
MVHTKTNQVPAAAGNDQNTQRQFRQQIKWLSQARSNKVHRRSALIQFRMIFNELTIIHGFAVRNLCDLAIPLIETNHQSSMANQHRFYCLDQQGNVQGALDIEYLGNIIDRQFWQQTVLKPNLLLLMRQRITFAVENALLGQQKLLFQCTTIQAQELFPLVN